MKNKRNSMGKLITLGIFPVLLSACGGEAAVSFSQDVKPIFDKNCIQCHAAGGAGEVTSGFNMETYGGLMKGTQYGPMVVAGDVEGSNLLVLMEGRADPSISMPHGENEPVAAKDIETIRAWIRQGAKNN
jgi:mono/diheme cytochrome c family protein